MVDIAFVAVTFTTAAYDISFYRFYVAYKEMPPGVKITSDVNSIVISLVITL